MQNKLTKAQRHALEIAGRGGVFGLGRSRQTILNLINRGLLTERRDALGYHAITDAGRLALSDSKENGNG